MLPFPAIDVAVPTDLEALVELAATPGARLVAGGTDVLVATKHRLLAPSLFVSTARVDALRGIDVVGDAIVIGAGTTLADIRRSPLVPDALRDACATVATSTIQEMGTLGGNIALDTRCLYYNQPQGWREALGGCLKAEGTVCHVAPKGAGCYATQSSDTVPVLWLLGATLDLRSVRGTRTVALADLFGRTDGRDWLGLAPDEIIVAIRIPRGAAPIAHRKVRPRASIDYGMLLVAVQRRGAGATAVLGAVGPTPLEVVVDVARDLPDEAHRAARPLSTHAWASTWRKHMVRVEVGRALAQLEGPHST